MKSALTSVRRASVAAAIIIGALCPWADALARDYIRIVNLPPDRALHLREQPDPGAKILAYIPSNSKEIISVGACDEKWCSLKFRGMSGWAFKRYLDLEAEPASQAAPGASQSLAASPASPPRAAASAPPESSRGYRTPFFPNGRVVLIQDEPRQRARVLGHIPSEAQGIEERGPCVKGWCPVRYDNVEGWSPEAYLLKGQLPAPSPAIAALQPGKAAAPAAPLQAASGAEFTYPVLAGVFARDPLAIREAPADAAAVTGSIPHDAVNIEGWRRCETKWCFVRYQGASGWALRRHLAEKSGEGVRRLRVVELEIGDALEVKEYPAAEAASIGDIPATARGIAEIGACGKDWCHVRYLGIAGWVLTRFLAAESGLPN